MKIAQLILISALSLGLTSGLQAQTTARTITDAIGNQETWIYQETLGVFKLQSRMSLVDGRGFSNQYDSSNNLISTTDEEGRITTYIYNATNQKKSMTEAVGTPEERTTTYEYISADIDIANKTISPSVSTGLSREVTTTHDSQYNPLSVTINGFTPNGTPVSRTTSYQYNAIGQVTQIDGPRTDVSDITTFVYNDCNIGGGCGELASFANAMGHVTTFDGYDGNGRLLQSTDSNGVVTTYVYHPRGWVLSMTQTPSASSSEPPRMTQYAYDNVGQLIQTITPEGIVITNTYDAAHYLRSVEDQLGNRIAYSYDLKGNRTQTDTHDPDSTLARTLETTYDHRNYVIALNAAGSVTQMVKDAVGNVSSQTDPNLNPSSTHTYDSLDRLTQMIDAIGGQTSYDFNVQDQLIQATSPNGAITQYEYDDLGYLVKETSPDRGITTYIHDAAGNMISKTDARGITVGYSYDALNRLVGVNYPGSNEDVAYAYDSCTQGIGRLCHITDETGITDYNYDGFGNIASETRLQDSVLYSTAYTWDAGDRLISMTYPNGRVVNYQRDVLRRLTAMDSTIDSTVQNIVHSRTFRGDNLLTGQTFGNGLIENRSYDTQGRLTSQVIGAHESRTYNYDPNSNVTAITRPENPVAYQYDPLDRLEAENMLMDIDTVITQVLTSWRYDSNGNRLNRISGTDVPGTPDCDPDIDPNCEVVCTPGDWCFQDGEKTQNYQYTPSSNQLVQRGNKNLTLDAVGNTLSDKNSKRMYAYNSANHLSQFIKNGELKAEYTYNATNQRTKKILHKEPDDLGNMVSHTFLYFYDLNGNLISEFKNGKPLRDYLWGDGMLIQMDKVKLKNDGETIVKSSLSIVNDHLNTPRLSTDETDTVVWKWDSNGFGEKGINKDPDGDGEKENLRLRFPGQYSDSESGLYYNWNRYYDPQTGRYITSDPIGLDGGINTYGYVYQNPLRFIDPEGKQAEISDTIDKTGDRGEFFGDLVCTAFNALYTIRLNEAKRKIKNFANSLAPCVKGCSLLCVEKTRHQYRVCTSDVFALVGDCPLSFFRDHNPFVSYSCRPETHTGEGGKQCCG